MLTLYFAFDPPLADGKQLKRNLKCSHIIKSVATRTQRNIRQTQENKTNLFSVSLLFLPQQD